MLFEIAWRSEITSSLLDSAPSPRFFVAVDSKQLSDPVSPLDATFVDNCVSVAFKRLTVGRRESLWSRSEPLEKTRGKQAWRVRVQASGSLGETPFAFVLGKRSKREMRRWVSVTYYDSFGKVTCQYCCDVVMFEQAVEKRLEA